MGINKVVNVVPSSKRLMTPPKEKMEGTGGIELFGARLTLSFVQYIALEFHCPLF